MIAASGGRQRWRPLAVFAAAILAFAGAGSAAAHADLISADPAPGSTVTGSPPVIRLSFSLPLESASNIELFTGQFQAVPGLTTIVAGSEMRGVLTQPLAPATYTVQWVAASDDGHTTQGSYQFAVAAAGSPQAGQAGALVAGAALVISVAAALLVLIFNRRRRV